MLDFGLPEKLTNEKGNTMKSAMMLKASTAVLCLGMMAACTDLKPIQAQIDELKSQVAKVGADATSAKDAATSASSAASVAQSAATNEKIDRMFKKSMSK